MFVGKSHTQEKPQISRNLLEVGWKGYEMVKRRNSKPGWMDGSIRGSPGRGVCRLKFRLRL